MRNLILALALFAFTQVNASAPSYVQVSKNSNIYFSPDSKSKFIATAKTGDVFEVYSKKGEWIGVFLFSGEDRYIRSNFAKTLKYSPSANISEIERKALFLN